ncbi:MAG: precorrin-8X methylmutase, partial [Dehalococcoidia bacterium]|nr:precorrin-8X methylmutase [Dehalococcoidia bacterium]
MSNPGIVLLAHGSRGEKIEGEWLRQISVIFQRKLGDGYVIQPAFLQFNSPGIQEAVRILVNREVRDIIVLPYFLLEGSHYHHHIPEELNRISKMYPDVKITIGRSLGVDDRIIDVAVDRLRETIIENPPFPPDQPLESSEIEKTSFNYLSSLFPYLDKSHEGLITKRVLHATADPAVLSLRFHPEAVASGISSLVHGGPIITDVRMIVAGINRRLASSLNCPILCAMEAAEADLEGGFAGTTKTATGMRNLADKINGSVIAVGNAPTALLSVLEMVNKGICQPGLIIGLPVGFVNAAEVKSDLLKSKVPYITLLGHRGGSSMAVACV